MTRALLACVFLLSACVPPQKLQRTQAEAEKFSNQLEEQRANARCNESAMPGTPEHMACRLGAK